MAINERIRWLKGPRGGNSGRKHLHRPAGSLVQPLTRSAVEFTLVPSENLTEPRSSDTRILLLHRTSYRYDRLVALGPQTIRLRPVPHTRTPILSYALRVSPQRHSLTWHQDPSGNFLARVLFDEPVLGFDINVELRADLLPLNPFDFPLDSEVVDWPFHYSEMLEQELTPFRRVGSVGAEFAALIAELPSTEQRTVNVLAQLTQSVDERISYRARLEAGVQTPEETLVRASGSCRDSAWLLVQLLRRQGFAARFVSGYLIQLSGTTSISKGQNAGSADLHAWAEAYLPGAGWLGLDATSGLLTSEGHIPLAASANPMSTAPVSGIVGKSAATIEFATSVARIPADYAIPDLVQ